MANEDGSESSLLDMRGCLAGRESPYVDETQYEVICKVLRLLGYEGETDNSRINRPRGHAFGAWHKPDCREGSITVSIGDNMYAVLHFDHDGDLAGRELLRIYEDGATTAHPVPE